MNRSLNLKSFAHRTASVSDFVSGWIKMPVPISLAVAPAPRVWWRIIPPWSGDRRNRSGSLTLRAFY